MDRRRLCGGGDRPRGGGDRPRGGGDRRRPDNPTPRLESTATDRRRRWKRSGLGLERLLPRLPIMAAPAACPALKSATKALGSSSTLLLRIWRNSGIMLGCAGCTMLLDAPTCTLLVRSPRPGLAVPADENVSTGVPFSLGTTLVVDGPRLKVVDDVEIVDLAPSALGGVVADADDVDSGDVAG